METFISDFKACNKQLVLRKVWLLQVVIFTFLFGSPGNLMLDAEPPFNSQTESHNTCKPALPSAYDMTLALSLLWFLPVYVLFSAPTNPSWIKIERTKSVKHKQKMLHIKALGGEKASWNGFSQEFLTQSQSEEET